MQAIVTPDTLAIQMEELLKATCAARGADFDQIKRTLFMRWFGNHKTTLDDPGRALLDRAYACRELGDKDGYKQACLAWTLAIMHIQIGDAIAFGDETPRVIRVEDIRIALDASNQALSYITFTGRCLSNKKEGLKSENYYGLITDSFKKVDWPTDVATEKQVETA